MADTTVRSYADIKGWFFWHDRMMFDLMLDAQPLPGNLIELGAYLGRSAVIIGDHLRPGERFVVIDLFGSETALGDSSDDRANRAENQHSYSTLTRTQFERNYLALHDELPEVVQDLSGVVLDHVEPGSVRFAHIDASHLYAQVAEDVRNTRKILQPDGVVVFDDHSNPNTPGVAAAVWEAVLTGDLVPFAVTPNKLYGTWGDPAKYLDAVRGLAAHDDRFSASEQSVLGHTVIRIKQRAEKAKPAAPVLDAAQLDVVAAGVANRLPSPPKLGKDELDEVAAALNRRLNPPVKRSDWVPPIAARWIRDRRRHG